MLPLPFVVLATCGGVFCAAHACRVWLTPLAVLLLAALSLACRFRQPWLAWAIPAAFFLAALRTSLVIVPAQQQESLLAGRQFRLQGVVCERIGTSDYGVTVLVRQASGIRVSLCGTAAELPEGRTIGVVVIGSRPTPRMNPGGFDQAAWLASQGVFLCCEIAPGEKISLVFREGAFNPAAWSRHMREKFYDLAAEMLTADRGALLTGLLLGDTHRITAKASSDLRKSGLAHLTSVSGANVSLLMLPVLALLKKSRVGRKLRIWLLLALLAGFGMLVGWPVSVTRAIFMAAFVLAGLLLRRKADPANALAAAAGLILAWDPLACLNVGFWLSSAATAGLILFSGSAGTWLAKTFPFLPHPCLAGLAGITSTQAILLPMLAASGLSVSGIGMLANIVALPLSSAITLATIVLLPLGITLQIWPAAAVFCRSLAAPLAYLLELLLRLADLGGRCSLARLANIRINAAFWLFWLVCLLGWLRANQKGQLSSLFRKLPAGLLRMRMPLLAIWILLAWLSTLNSPPVQAWFFSVGQGDAILIAGKDGHTVLVDGGKPGSGWAVLGPALDALGIGKIDLAIATHGHADHAGGLIELITAGRISRLAVPVGLLASSTDSLEQDLGQDLLRAAGQARITVSELAGNDTIALGRLITLHVLYPERPPDSAGVAESGEKTTGSDSSGNACSLQILAELAGMRLLLTGDCEAEAEKAMLAQGTWPKADVLKVAHHGSRFTTTEAFLAGVHPQAAIISVGPNMYGHPAADTLNRLRQAGCRIFRTDRQGAVQLVAGPNNWHLTGSQPLFAAEP